jgi:hypothetical protein
MKDQNENIYHLNNNYLLHKNNNNELLFKENKSKIIDWLNLKTDIKPQDACAMFCLFTRENDITITKILLEDERFEPTYDNSAPLIQASLRNNIEIVKLLLNDGRCTASDRGNNIINGENNLETFLYIINHKTFNHKTYSNITICNIAGRNDSEANEILQILLDRNIFLSKDGLYYALFSAINFNSYDNFNLLIKQDFIVGNENNNSAILSSIKNKQNKMTSKLFSIPEVQEDLKNKDMEFFKKIKIQTVQYNF